MSFVICTQPRMRNKFRTEDSCYMVGHRMAASHEAWIQKSRKWENMREMLRVVWVTTWVETKQIIWKNWLLWEAENGSTKHVKTVVTIPWPKSRKSSYVSCFISLVSSRKGLLVFGTGQDLLQEWNSPSSTGQIPGDLKRTCGLMVI